MKIAVCGEIRSGKDTFSEYVMTMFPKMEKLYFAEGIEELIRKYFPDAFKNGKPRKHFQDIGQFMRSIDADVWVKYTELIYKEKSKTISDFICTDLRQPNEYKWLKENGFTVVKVETDFEIRKERAKKAGDVFNEESFNHPVERAIRELSYDYLVTNNGTLEELYNQADSIISKLKGERKNGIS